MLLESTAITRSPNLLTMRRCDGCRRDGGGALPSAGERTATTSKVAKDEFWSQTMATSARRRLRRKSPVRRLPAIPPRGAFNGDPPQRRRSPQMANRSRPRGGSLTISGAEKSCTAMSLSAGLPLVLVGKIARRSGGSNDDRRWAETFLHDACHREMFRKYCTIKLLAISGDYCQFEASVNGNRIRRRFTCLHAAFMAWVRSPRCAHRLRHQIPHPSFPAVCNQAETCAKGWRRPMRQSFGRDRSETRRGRPRALPAVRRGSRLRPQRRPHMGRDGHLLRCRWRPDR